MKNKQPFRLGRLGAAEAHLYEVAAFDENEQTAAVRWVAAASPLEALSYLHKAEPGLRVASITHRGLVLLLSGSPHF